MKLPNHIEQVVRAFQRLQGVGRKTAERYVFDMVSHWTKESIQDFCNALQRISASNECCGACRAPTISEEGCLFCSKERKEARVIAVVAALKDLYSLEALNTFHGTYFLLDTLLSPLDRRGISENILEKLYQRIQEEQIVELFLAFDSSPEGEATSFYLSEIIKKQALEKQRFSLPKITVFATGVPAGSTFDYIDRSTLGKAFLNRVAVEYFAKIN